MEFNLNNNMTLKTLAWYARLDSPEEYKEWQLLPDKIDRMQKSVEDRYYRLVIEQSKLDALPKSNYKKEKTK